MPVKSKLPATSLVVAKLGAHIAEILCLLEATFKPGVKLSLIVRVPGNEDADILVTSDQIPELEALLKRSKAREEIDLS